MTISLHDYPLPPLKVAELAEDDPVLRARAALGAAQLTRPGFLSHAESIQVGSDLDTILTALFALPDRLDGGDLGAFARRVGFSAERAEIVAAAGPVGEHARLARADLLRTASGLAMVELNVSSALGGFEASAVNRLFLREPWFARFAAEHGLDFTDPAELLASHLRQALTGPDAVALVDTESSYGETRPVLDVVASLLQQYGIDAFSCHLGDLVVEGDVVIAHGRRVGLVHRYFTLSELTGTGSEAQAGRDVLRGLAASGTPVVSPLSTSCFGNKRSLALLWSSEARSSMTPDEIDVVERLVPWLAPLDARPGEIHDAPDDILAFCLAQRDGLVLKPAFGAGGKGVVIGSEVTDEQWRDLVLGVDPSRYVVQRAIVAMPEAFPEDALGATSSWRVNYGVFHIGHSFGGGFVRAAPADGSRVIAEHSGARMGCLFVGGPWVQKAITPRPHPSP